MSFMQLGVNHIMNRDDIYYYFRSVPCDISDFYENKRLSFSIKTKSINTTRRLSKSIEQKLEDYWLGLRLQNIDIPQLRVSSKPSIVSDHKSLCLTEALELYLKLTGQGKDHGFFRTTKRNLTKIFSQKDLMRFNIL